MHARAGSAEEQAPAIAAAVEKLSSDDDVDLLALARDPKGVDLAELEAKLEARAGEHEAAGERERKASAEYWRHVGALASLRSIRKAREAYAKAAALDPGDVEALSQGGWLAMQAGDLAASERAFQHVLGIGGGSAICTGPAIGSGWGLAMSPKRGAAWASARGLPDRWRRSRTPGQGQRRQHPLAARPVRLA